MSEAFILRLPGKSFKNLLNYFLKSLKASFVRGCVMELLKCGVAAGHFALGEEK